MKNKTLAILSPLCLCLLAANAEAALEPFTIAASESLQHHTNINHSADALATADWMSQTELSAAVDQALGRDKLVASAAVDFNRYGKSADKALNSTGYRASGEFDWSTIGDLSGALGADVNRRQYIAGETAEPLPNGDVTTSNVRNLQTDSHAFARFTLGGDSRWQIYGGGDVNQRKYSNSSFIANEEHQWSTNAGTRYSTSPDLSFGLQGSYSKGEYPHGAIAVAPATVGGPSDFSSRSVSLTSRLQASGNSALDGNIGYTSDSNDAVTGDRHFISGALNWHWTPPSHFTVNLGLSRSSDADASTGANTGAVNVNNLQGTSINNAAHLETGVRLHAEDQRRRERRLHAAQVLGRAAGLGRGRQRHHPHGALLPERALSADAHHRPELWRGSRNPAWRSHRQCRQPGAGLQRQLRAVHRVDQVRLISRFPS